MEAAFQTGAGFTAGEVSILIRVMILSIFSLWSGWVIWKQFKLVVSNGLTIGEWFFNVVTNLILLTAIAFITS